MDLITQREVSDEQRIARIDSDVNAKEEQRKLEREKNYSATDPGAENCDGDGDGNGDGGHRIAVDSSSVDPLLGCDGEEGARGGEGIGEGGGDIDNPGSSSAHNESGSLPVDVDAGVAVEDVEEEDDDILAALDGRHAPSKEK
jgi:hypothetical protein